MAKTGMENKNQTKIRMKAKKGTLCGLNMTGKFNRPEVYFFKLLMPFFLIFMLISCLPDPLEVKNIPAVKPQIVVSTQIIPDSSLVVILTKSFSALDAGTNTDPESLLEMIAINDATVTITGKGRTDTLEFLDKGLYGGVLIPLLEMEFYELHVSNGRGKSICSGKAANRIQRSRGRPFY
jgi:hypothetical protein